MEDKDGAVSPPGGNGQTIREWLGLDDVDEAVIEFKLRLTLAIRRERRAAGLSQEQFAAKLGCSQSRVAKIENGQVSTDILMAAFFAIDGKVADLVEAGG